MREPRDLDRLPEEHSTFTDSEPADPAAVCSHRLFQALIESSHDSIVLLSPDGRTVYQSPAVERQLGFHPSELVGRNTFDLVHHDDRPAAMARVHAALLGE